MARSARRAATDTKARRVTAERQVLLAHSARRASREPRAHRVAEENKVHRVFSELREQEDTEAQEDQRVPPALAEYKVIPEKKERRALAV